MAEIYLFTYEIYLRAMNFPNTSKPDEFGVPSQQLVSVTKQYSKIDLPNACYATDR